MNSPGGFAPVSNVGWSPIQSKPHSDEAGTAHPGFCLTSLPHKRLPDDEQTLEGSARPPRACPGGRDPPATRPRDEPGRLRPAGMRCHQPGKPTAIFWPAVSARFGAGFKAIRHFAPSCRRRAELPGVCCVSVLCGRISRRLPWRAAVRRKAACLTASLRQTGARRFPAKGILRSTSVPRARPPPAVPGPGALRLGEHLARRPGADAAGRCRPGSAGRLHADPCAADGRRGAARRRRRTGPGLTRRADGADTLADRAWHALAAEDLDAVRRRPVIDLPQAVAARADLVAARPGQDVLLRPCAGGGATRHGRVLADQEQNENRHETLSWAEAERMRTAGRASHGNPPELPGIASARQG